MSKRVVAEATKKVCRVVAWCRPQLLLHQMSLEGPSWGQPCLVCHASQLCGATPHCRVVSSLPLPFAALQLTTKAYAKLLQKHNRLLAIKA